MSDRTLLGPWVRRFMLEHLVAERNLAFNTQCSYRDALTLLIPFVADRLHQSVDRLTLVGRKVKNSEAVENAGYYGRSI